ncbi:MAG: hypothetical protein AAGA03_02870 [Planctomycetota bacterium]
MKITWFIVVSIVGLFPWNATAALVDGFDNGVVQDADSSPGFWGTTSFGGTANEISESGGNLTFTIGDDDGTNESDFGGASIFSNSFRSDFNFLSRQVMIEVRGIQFSSVGNPFVSTNQRHLRVGFVSSGNTAFAADDAVFVRIFETGVSIRSKVNEANSNGQGSEQASLGNINGVGGVDLILEPGSTDMVDYSLTAYFPSGSIAGSTSGSFAFDFSQWDQGDESARLLVMAQELDVPGGDQVFTASLGSISVTAVPEPSTSCLASLAALAVLLKRCRRGHSHSRVAAV